jgi:hypothetical protein
LEATFAGLGSAKTGAYLTPSTFDLLSALRLPPLTASDLSRLVIQQRGAAELLLKPETVRPIWAARISAMLRLTSPPAARSAASRAIW